MPKLVIEPGHSFLIHGRRMNAGEEFDCSEREAVIWRLKGWARDAAQARRGRYARNDMRAEDDR